MTAEWSNWSGSVGCTPCRMIWPATEAEMGEAVRAAATAAQGVRVVGTGHSFTPIAAGDGLLISLDRWKGVAEHDRAGYWATVRGGTKLRDVGAELLTLGLAMENLGDIDVQSIAGAIGTGTHGTGPTLGNLSAQVTAMRLIAADGEAFECSIEQEPETLRAARVSMGMLGITSAVTLRLLPAYLLHERVWRMPIDACLEQLDDLIAANVRYEFFWYPTEDTAECKTLNPTDLPADATPPVAVSDGGAADARGERLVRERVGWGAHVIPSIRNLRFNEMEYAVPADHGPDCFREVRARMLTHHADVLWPVEYRTLAADDAYLSPAHGRATVTISIHQDARLPYREFFADIEPIFRACGGRPHWGKVHNLTGPQLRDLYPQWDAFRAVRARMDPDGRFLNGYLRELFAIV